MVSSPVSMRLSTLDDWLHIDDDTAMNDQAQPPLHSFIAAHLTAQTCGLADALAAAFLAEPIMTYPFPGHLVSSGPMLSCNIKVIMCHAMTSVSGWQSG